MVSVTLHICVAAIGAENPRLRPVKKKKLSPLFWDVASALHSHSAGCHFNGRSLPTLIGAKAVVNAVGFDLTMAHDLWT